MRQTVFGGEGGGDRELELRVEGFWEEERLGANPTKALSIPPLMSRRMCLEVSMTTPLRARDVPRQHGQQA